MATIASSTVLPIVGCLALACRWRPARLLRHPEDVLGPVLVVVLGVGALVDLLGEEPCVLLLEGVGDVLQEDQPEDDVLVLGGVHVVAELVGRLPERRLEAEGAAPVAFPSPARTCRFAGAFPDGAELNLGMRNPHLVHRHAAKRRRTQQSAERPPS